MKKIAYYQNLHLNQLNHLKKELKLRKYLEHNIAWRNKWINNQNKLGYRQELDNLKRAMESSISDTTKEQLQKRADEMKKLLSS